MLVFNFAELGHRAMDAIQSGFKQQAKCPGAAAFLEGITPALQSGDLPFQPGLFLFQPSARALLDRERFRGLLHRLLAAGQGLQQGLPLLLQGLQGLLDFGLLLAVTVEVSAEFLKTFGVLTLALLPLLQLLLKGFDAALQLLAALAAAFLFVEPGAGAAGHIRHSAAGHLHSGLGGAALRLCCLQGLVMGLLLELSALLLQLLAASGQVVAQVLKRLGLLLVLRGLAFELPSLGVESGQFGLHRKQLVFPQGLHLVLETLELLGGLGQSFVGRGQGSAIPLFLGLELLLSGPEDAQGHLGGLEGQHHLLLAAELQPTAQLLVLTRLGAVLFKPLATGKQFLLDDPAALLPLLHIVELAPGLLDARVEQGHPRQFIDQAAAIAVAHRHDAGHIALHHDIAAFGIDAQAPELGLQLLQVAGDSVGAVAGAVGATGHHPQPAGDRPFRLSGIDPGTVLRRLQPLLCSIGLPVAEIKAHADGGFRRFAGFENGAVDQVRKAISPHPPARGQAQAEQDPIEDVAFAGAVRAGDHGESLLERDRHRSAERLELLQTDLIDVDQQDLKLSANRN